MKLLIELRRILTAFADQKKIIDWIPTTLVNEERDLFPLSNFGVFLVHDGGDRIDIGIDKRLYLKIFTEAHCGWHQFLDTGKQVSSLTASELDELYLVTLGYLFTTNDNHMLIKIHEQVLAELYKQDATVLDQELELLTTLVSSKLLKINKSMLIWNLIKRLFMVMFIAEQNTKPKRYESIVDRVLMACDHHYANYYANNFLRVLIRLNRVFDREDRLFDALLSLCHRHLNDVSLWMTLLVYFEQSDPLEFVVEDYNHSIAHFNQLFGSKFAELEYHEKQTDPRSFDLMAKQLEWLLLVRCTSKSPYVALLRNFNNPQYVKAIIESSKKQVKPLSFESDQYNPLRVQEEQFVETLNYVLKLF